MAKSFNILTYNHNESAVGYHALSYNTPYHSEIGNHGIYNTSNVPYDLSYYAMSSYFINENKFDSLIDYGKTENFGNVLTFDYELTSFDSSVAVEFNLYAGNILFDKSSAYKSYKTITCEANSRSYGYFGESYVNTSANASLDYYWFEINVRSGSAFNLVVDISSVNDDGVRYLDQWDLNENYPSYLNTIKGNNYNNGYNAGYQEAVDALEPVGSYQVGYKEGFNKGSEVGYQKAQKEETILADTFEVIGSGLKATEGVLSSKISNNLTIGQVAFIPVTVSVILMIIRSLVA